ncbi:MAG: lysophospholipid acyltransferase family protein [Chitinispirillales bacterium]|jgi:KDO2-lipid IV(A) lauroyltransferase|nr:lysophospholipid acyltransferase family protein [Chitinispirillales bacterium]
MKKINTKASHCLEYAALRAVELAVNLIPRGLALALGASAGRLLCLFGVYRKIVQKNLDHVALWDKSEASKITPKLYRNIGRYAVDFLRRSRKLPPHRLHDYGVYQNARAAGKGTVMVLAHFGNWEILASIWGKQTDDLNVVAKPMGNPLVESWLLEKRTAQSVNTIYTKHALRGMLTALKRNGVAAILIDQYLGGSMGAPAPFLGKTASTVRTVAGLVLKTGAAAVPIYAIMRGDGSYDIHFFAAEQPAALEGQGEDAAINAIQAQHNDILSGWIRQYPEHWFGWFHRRFRGYLDYN